MKAFKIILDNSGIIAFIRKENGSTAFISAGIRDFGYKVEDFISGKVTVKDLIHPEDVERVILELTENALEGASELTQTYRIRTKKEYVRTVEDKTTFIRDENGNLIYLIGILTDITDN